MRRKLASLGASLVLAAFAAAFLPPLGLFLAAAVCVLLAAVLRRCPAFWPALGAAVGLVWFVGYGALVVEPVQSLAGKTMQCTAVAETDCVYNYTGEHLRGTLLVEQLEGRPVRLRVACQDIPAAAVGERFTAELTFSRLNDDSYRLTRMARGTLLQARAENGTRLGASTAPRFFWYVVRDRLSQTLRYWLPRQLGGLAAAMLLGDRSGLDSQTVDTFRAAGVAHLLAVSGLHVGLVCGLLFSRRRRFFRPALLAQSALLAGYLLLTGGSASATRAGCVYLLALLARFLLQPFDLLTATGVVAALFCLWNPYAPCDVGFQLSFCAVLGVQAALAVSARLRHKMDHWPELLRRPLGWLADSVLVSAMAALATLPSLVANGLTVSGTGVLCNLLVVWMLLPALLLGMAVLVLAPLPFASHAASLLLGLWLKWLLAAVTWCASLPFARLVLPKRYTLAVLALAALLVLVLAAARRLRTLWPLVVAVAAAAVVLGVFWHRGEVRIQLVGTAGNPCAVITCGSQAAVLFRGGVANLNEVQDTLRQLGSPELTLLVDLRETPKELDFPDTEVLLLEEQTAYGVRTVWTDLTLEWYNTGSANLAVLHTDGGTVGFLAGSLRLNQPVQVDVFCAAGTVSDSVQANRIVTTSPSPKWLDKVGQTPVYYGNEPVLLLKEGRDIRIEEAKALAVQ